ncbi:hypothetical protein J2X63_000769 [Agromyces sp. 3263]|uniref:MEDS domain-containing protein n=1 Tax=Agromyces sp. 3263 TaxID=2817750 RepID=UPI00285F2C7E|nr:MEDS domain-containing protein [Agromyces sp. 3263]MDR6905083.1 hypothetical protein [Agromyces sp. 3263]
MPPEFPSAREPVTFAGGVLDPYRHVCAFVDAPWVDPVFDPFIADGVERGDRLLYLVDPATSAAPVNRLRRLGFDAGALLEDHRAEVRTWTETYLRGGSFDQAAMLDVLDEVLVAQRSPRIRMLCDMGWAAGRADLDALIEFEARANFIHAQHDHLVICSYEATKFDGAFVVDILRTHPMVLIGGMLQENPFFIPPSEFLDERDARAVS